MSPDTVSVRLMPKLAIRVAQTGWSALRPYISRSSDYERCWKESSFGQSEDSGRCGERAAPVGCKGRPGRPGRIGLDQSREDKPPLAST